jgi:hypothetical protein
MIGARSESAAQQLPPKLDLSGELPEGKLLAFDTQ